MELKLVTREEAERAFTLELAGDSVCYEGGKNAIITAVKLPDVPSQGGVAQKGFLPLTYVFAEGETVHTYESDQGPEVDEAKAFLRSTLPDFRIDQRLKLWFEDTWVAEQCGCGCGCDE